MSRKVDYAEWPECQPMTECTNKASIGDGGAFVCLKDGDCTCLQLGYTRDEDKELIEGDD